MTLVHGSELDLQDAHEGARTATRTDAPTVGAPTGAARVEGATGKLLTSVEDLVEALASLDVPSPWFRGQAVASWPLVPSLLRNGGHWRREADMLKRFKQETSHLVGGDFDEWDWIALAQHHGLPTRLLDWTTNPLVGLYFAVEDTDEARGQDGRLFALDPERLNNRSIEGAGVLLLGEDSVLDDYLVGKSVQSRLPVAVVARRKFHRIGAQAGTFTLTHRADPTPFEEHLAGEPGALTSWVVPQIAKEPIRQQLRALRIDEATIYSDLDHWAHHISEEYMQ